jgi:hypothetical protein
MTTNLWVQQVNINTTSKILFNYELMKLPKVIMTQCHNL